MFREEGHPDTSLSHWKSFCQGFSPFVIKEVIARKECNVADWFLPLARGAGVASDYLLRRTRYQAGMGCPPGWYEASPAYFERHLGEGTFLSVRDCKDTNLWTVERLPAERRNRDYTEILVHAFGSTPIFTRNPQAAMCLTEHFHANDLQHGLRWVRSVPQNHKLAIEWARQRQVEEALLAVRS
jgi:hypothetical protein